MLAAKGMPGQAILGLPIGSDERLPRQGRWRMSHGIDGLVHNIGHHDVYLLACHDDGEFTARPRGLGVQTLTEPLSESVEVGEWEPTALDGRPHGVHLAHPIEYPRAATGQDRARQAEIRGEPPSDLAQAVVTGAYFPVLAPVLEEWLSTLTPGWSPVLVLLATSPIESALQGTGTAAIARTLARFVRAVRDDVEVVLAPEMTGNPHSFEGLSTYFPSQLRPCIDTLRRRCVAQHGARWAERFRLRLSLSTGTTPVIQAVQSSLRTLRPETIHVPYARGWSAPGRWLDVHTHPFSRIDQRPAAPVADLEDRWASAAAEEIAQWRDEFIACRERVDESELNDFWHRKGRKAVLAVLVIDRGGHPHTIRSINLEVSLPTGTLCAERNAIGTALAQDPTLCRSSIRAIAVLSIDHGGAPNPLAPCGACREWLAKISEVNPDFKVVTFEDTSCRTAFVDEVS